MFGLFKKKVLIGDVIGRVVDQVEAAKGIIDKSASKSGVMSHKGYECNSHIMCYILGTAAINLSNYNDAEKVLLDKYFSEVWGERVNVYTDKEMTHEDLMRTFTVFYQSYEMLVSLFHDLDETMACLYEHKIRYLDIDTVSYQVVEEVSKDVALILKEMILGLNKMDKKYIIVNA